MWSDRFERSLSATANWPGWLRYAATILLVLSVGSLWNQFDTDRPYQLFYPTIVVCSVFLNRGSGYLATVAAAAFASAFLLPRTDTGVWGPSDKAGFILFILIGFAIAALVEMLRDRVADLRHSEQRALMLASEKQLLLDELAHRTRNDLTSVATLLTLQASSGAAEASEALTAAASRVRTIARIHRRLDIAGNRIVLDSKAFIEELCDDLHLAWLAGRPIRLDVEIENHPIGIEKAVPIGLIVNELVTNAAKHAFPGDRRGTIEISFRREDSTYVLRVQDNGVGQAAGEKKGLGSKIIPMLSAQLGSEVQNTVGKEGVGTSAVVKIPGKARSN